jgi:hypothetical protein
MHVFPFLSCLRMFFSHKGIKKKKQNTGERAQGQESSDFA